MSSEDMISEELLLSSILVPKKRLPLELSTSDAGMQEESRLSSSRSVVDVEGFDGRLSELQNKFAEQKLIHDEALEKAKEAANLMKEILDEILSISSSTKIPQQQLQLQQQQKQQKVHRSEPEPVGNVIRVTSVHSTSKILPKKPRSLLFPKDLPDSMITSTIDGSIQSWSVSKKGIEASIYLPSAIGQPVFPEDICLNHRSTHLAMAFGGEEGGSGGEGSPSLTNRLYFMSVPGRTGADPKGILLDPPFPVHTKSIASLASFYDGPSERSIFLTGGFDKTLALWDVNDFGTELKARQVHSRHTSAIHTICQQVQSRNIWRLIGCNLSTGQLFSERRLNDRISQLIANSLHPSTLLMVQAKTIDQLSLLDVRQPAGSAQPLSFGWAESGNLTRYLKPSWHPDGNLVACGASQPSSKANSGIMIWDTRCVGETRRAPLQVVDLNSDKKYLRTEFHPTKNCLVALASDGSLSFLDYSIA